MSKTPVTRCALYLRNGCADDHDTTYDATQLGEQFRDDCRRIFGDDVDIGLYHDYGFSGMHTERPALQRLLRDIREREVDIVAFPDALHLSRNNEDAAMLSRYFATYAVRLIDASALIRECL